MFRLLTVLPVAFVISSAVADSPAAKPRIVVKTKYYTITGMTSRELQAEMERNGPGGHWAYTGWYVSWTADCMVTVTIDYELPEWTDRDRAAPGLRASWDRMFEALTIHEQQHARHGIEAAIEIEDSECAGNPETITQKWARQDKIFDAETDHGKNRGVVLP